MDIRVLSAIEYAAMRDKTAQAVTHQIRRKLSGREYYLPGVIKVNKYGRFYTLEVDVSRMGQ